MEEKRIRVIPPYCENLIRQIEEVKMGYSLEELRQILEDDSWKGKYTDFHVPEKLMQFYRMDGYMEALKILSWMKMERMPVTVASEEEKLSQELTEDIGNTVRHTISRFLAQRDHLGTGYDETSERGAVLKSMDIKECISKGMADAACFYGNLGYGCKPFDITSIEYTKMALAAMGIDVDSCTTIEEMKEAFIAACLRKDACSIPPEQE